ncbi:MAG: hypothetical protein Dasosvirus16_6 [Dasosvirus sp.]|uniref:Uncharacterized protein n=1 Tax=Dasosvirus sp. TaxID=2487764 RepID=A0A3G4ZW19_9VIRU|nr:MAG: hypothetical protein Dasosvirus16_6 [Dasosvirus sp.]
MSAQSTVSANILYVSSCKASPARTYLKPFLNNRFAISLASEIGSGE